MVLSLQDKWIWDSWYAHDGDKWHVYFLQADKSLGDPDLRHWNVTQAHATSADLTNWTHHGTCFAPAPEPAWDDMTTWTGSVLQDDTGLWHLFYTGARKAEDGLVQRIGHATSTDMHNWSRVGSGLCLDISGDAYETFDPDIWHDRAMRDPWVIRDPDGDGWLMYFTARIDGVDEPNAAGAIGFATSPDLNDWTLHPPVFSGGFGQLEVPQVFEQNGRWYCLFCTDKSHWSTSYIASVTTSPTSGSHYLIADGPRGPWRIAPGPFLDGHAPHHRYASRILDTEQGLVIIGFVDRPDGSDFVGHITDPDPISIDNNGHLQVRSLTKATE